MRRPWQIWLLFTLCLLAAVPAMLWVTWTTIQLERTEFQAQLQAKQEEVVSRALWRIDARLTPLLAEEAARPDFVYQPLGSSSVPLEASNTLQATPSHVLLHFELTDSGQGASPQVAKIKTAKSTEPVTEFQHRLNTMVSSCSFSDLLAQLPQQSLPQLTILAFNGENPGNEQTQVVGNNFAYDEALAQAPINEQLNNSTANDAPRQSANPPPPTRQQSAALPNENPLQGELANGSGYDARGGRDLQQRNSAYQAFTQRTIAQQRLNGRAQSPQRQPVAIREGICRPLWIGDKLLFARRVQRGDETVIQGCWLNWETLKAELLAEVGDLVSSADLRPVREGEELLLGRLLATLPVQLVAPVPTAELPAWSPIRLALCAAWGCLALAGAASAWLLQGVVTLSERRASFVSAVTHELRTPLTTFRMYAEMLAAGMVTAPEQRQKYLETLCVEADRLTHLVDNVLLYARLERARPGQNRTMIAVDALLERCASRLSDRATQSQLALVVKCNDAARDSTLYTDPGAVEQIVFNLIDNACKYAVPASDKSLVLAVDCSERWLEISVRDHGPGLSASARRSLFQPFSKTSEEAALSAPGVGLGLALCKRLAADLGGRLKFSDGAPGAKFSLQLPRGLSATPR